MASGKVSSVGPGSDIPQWQLDYESAMKETERKVLFKRVEVAEAAILSRRAVLMKSSDGFVERQEIKMALDKLRTMKKEVLKFF
jgi:hypothetical protein